MVTQASRKEKKAKGDKYRLKIAAERTHLHLDAGLPIRIYCIVLGSHLDIFNWDVTEAVAWIMAGNLYGGRV